MLMTSTVARAEPVAVVPPAGTFQMRDGLSGHPRLYFTSADIDALRARATGPASFYYDRAQEAYRHYVSRPVDVTDSWKHYLFGFWGQFSMVMFYLVEGDQAYADTAIDWALHYARLDDWLADDIVPMDIT